MHPHAGSRGLCQGIVLSHVAGADRRQASDLLETIGSVGGETALQSVAAAAQGKQLELRDTASQLLGKWMTADAAPVLLVMAEEGNRTISTEFARLRGYIRIARQFRLPVKERVAICVARHSNLQIATTNESSCPASTGTVIRMVRHSRDGSQCCVDSNIEE